MAYAKSRMLQVGDWVGGTSFMDERLIGYVDAVSGGKVRVFVTQSDHEEAVGEIVEGSLAKLERLEDYVPNTVEDLRSLMDLALMARDEAWFNELSAALRVAQAKTQGGSPGEDKYTPPYGNGNGHWNRRVKID
jgi:hypothetical protein